MVVRTVLHDEAALPARRGAVVRLDAVHERVEIGHAERDAKVRHGHRVAVNGVQVHLLRPAGRRGDAVEHHLVAEKVQVCARGPARPCQFPKSGPVRARAGGGAGTHAPTHEPGDVLPSEQPSTSP